MLYEQLSCWKFLKETTSSLLTQLVFCSLFSFPKDQDASLIQAEEKQFHTKIIMTNHHRVAQHGKQCNVSINLQAQ